MSPTRISSLLLAAALLATPACDEASTSAQSSPTLQTPQPQVQLDPVSGTAIEYTMPKGDWFKPAYRRTLATKSALKADEFDDIRFQYPERYAITVPPANKATIRPMVEWEPMKAIVMQWPSYYLSSTNASATVAAIATNTATVAEVWIVTQVGGGSAVRSFLVNSGMPQTDVDNKVKIMETSTDSIWFIDSGPLPIIDTTDNSYAFADFRYYHQRANDDGVSTSLARHLPTFGLERAAATYRMPLSVEGGTFQATATGICITGNRQLYYMSCDSPTGCDNSIRFMPLDEVQTHPLANEMRQIWKDYLGCKDTIITNSITDDGTGHIDMYLKIVDDNTVMIGDYRPPFANGTPQETNKARMDANAAFLAAYVPPGGGAGFNVVRLVMPGHRTSSDGPTPFTYINSTFINGLNLWPATEYPEWEASRDLALSEWQAAMPTYTHQYIDSTELSFWSGAIHCITRTVPDLPVGNWVEDGACQGGTCEVAAGGYDGLCNPNGVSSQVCWGPEWECGCNDCEMACPEGSLCPEGLTAVGCCDGDTLVTCQDGEPNEAACPAGCGWDYGNNYYDCANGSIQPGTSDPTGNAPRSCDAIFCNPDCTDRACGGDGCGGSCGTCSGGDTCDAVGQCKAPCVDECAVGEAGCAGAEAFTCGYDVDGCLIKLTTDCEATGQICAAGTCFDAPPVEAAVETSADNGSGGSDAGGGGSDAGSSTDVGTVGPPLGDDGCTGGTGPQQLTWPLLALLGLFMWRRREIHVVAPLRRR